MNKDTIRCPICKGQHITIIEEIARDRYFHIDKGKLLMTPRIADVSKYLID